MEEQTMARLKRKAKAGLEMIAARESVTRGRNLTISEAIEYMLAKCEPEIAEAVGLTAEPADQIENDRHAPADLLSA